MSLISDDQVQLFIESGYLVVPSVVAASDLEALNAEVDGLIAGAPPPAGHVGNHFYWQHPATSPALFDVLERPQGILQVARDLVGDDGSASRLSTPKSR
jgi:hypothetical protein